MKGFIYIIRSHQTDDIYYGSTTQMLCRRMATHRSHYKKWINGDNEKGFTTCYNILKYEDAYIELVEEIEFQNRQELTAREGHYIRENNCVNKLIAGRTGNQYYKDNQNKINERHKQYNKEHKEQIKEYYKKYAEEHKDEVKKRSKQHYEANKDKRKEQNQQYAKANRDKINEYQRKYRASKKSQPNL